MGRGHAAHGPGEYRTRLEPIELPAEGTRRERLAGFMANQARAYERLSPTRRSSGGRSSSRSGSAGASYADERAHRPRRPAHPHARLRRRVERRADPQPRRGARTRRDRHHRPRARRRRPRGTRDGPPRAACASRSSSARRSVRAAATSWRCSSSSASGPGSRSRDDCPGPRAGRLAIIAHPLVPYPLCASGRSIRRLLPIPTRVSTRRDRGASTQRPPARAGAGGCRRSSNRVGLPAVAAATPTRGGRRSPPTRPSRQYGGGAAPRDRRGHDRLGRRGVPGWAPAQDLPRAAGQECCRAARRGARQAAARRHRSRPGLPRRPPPAGPPGREPAVKIGLVTPYIYPLPGGVNGHVATCTRT
jgi:hypothetical protein